MGIGRSPGRTCSATWGSNEFVFFGEDSRCSAHEFHDDHLRTLITQAHLGPLVPNNVIAKRAAAWTWVLHRHLLQISIVLDIRANTTKSKKCFDIGTKPPGEYDDDQKQLLFLECDNRHEHIDFKTLVFFYMHVHVKKFHKPRQRQHDATKKPEGAISNNTTCSIVFIATCNKSSAGYLPIGTWKPLHAKR